MENLEIACVQYRDHVSFSNRSHDNKSFKIRPAISLAVGFILEENKEYIRLGWLLENVGDEPTPRESGLLILKSTIKSILKPNIKKGERIILDIDIHEK